MAPLHNNAAWIHYTPDVQNTYTKYYIMYTKDVLFYAQSCICMCVHRNTFGPFSIMAPLKIMRSSQDTTHGPQLLVHGEVYKTVPEMRTHSLVMT